MNEVRNCCLGLRTDLASIPHDCTTRYMLGKLQASGDNLLKVVPAFCDRLAHDGNATAPVSRKNKPSVYFDFLAFHMVRQTIL